MRESSLAKRVGYFLTFNGLSLFAFLSVLIIPFLYGFMLTFTDWNAISDGFRFIGLQNYATVFSDKEFVRQFLITIRYVVISAVLCNVFAFTIAYFLTSGMRGQNFLRGGFSAFSGRQYTQPA